MRVFYILAQIWTTMHLISYDDESRQGINIAWTFPCADQNVMCSFRHIIKSPPQQSIPQNPPAQAPTMVHLQYYEALCPRFFPLKHSSLSYQVYRRPTGLSTRAPSILLKNPQGNLGRRERKESDGTDLALVEAGNQVLVLCEGTNYTQVEGGCLYSRNSRLLN